MLIKWLTLALSAAPIALAAIGPLAVEGFLANAPWMVPPGTLFLQGYFHPPTGPSVYPEFFGQLGGFTTTYLEDAVGVNLGGENR